MSAERAIDHQFLWREYRGAFRQFAQSAQKVQSLKANPHAPAASVEMALLELEKSHLHYNQCRDALACALLAESNRNSRLNLSFELEPVRVDHIREIAELLWELNGRPAGTADDDWYRAEQIVRRATSGETTNHDYSQQRLAELSTA